MGKPKPKPPLGRKVSKAKIKELTHKYLILEEDNIAEDGTTSEDYIEEDNSILVNSSTSKSANLADIYNIISAT